MLMPRPPSALDTGWDKLNHVLAFAAPAFAGLAAGAGRGSRRVLWLGLLAWGAAIEVLQIWIPPRSADLLDWMADGLGIALGTAVFAATAWWFSRRLR
jgi:VanZ family protein